MKGVGEGGGKEGREKKSEISFMLPLKGGRLKR